MPHFVEITLSEHPQLRIKEQLIIAKLVEAINSNPLQITGDGSNLRYKVFTNESHIDNLRVYKL